MLEYIFETLLEKCNFRSGVVSRNIEVLSYLFVTAAISDVGFVLLFILLWEDSSYVEAKGTGSSHTYYVGR